MKLLLTSSLIFLFSGFSEAARFDLPSLLLAAGKNNPEIKSSLKEAEAAEYKIMVARSLADPVIKYTGFISPVETKNGPQEEIISFSQKFPFPGKLSLKRKASEAAAKRAGYKAEAVKRNIFAKIKFYYYELYFINGALRVAGEDEGILGAMEKSALAKYEAGLKPQSDILKLQVKKSEVLEKIYLLTQKKESLLSALADLAALKSLPEIVELENLPLPEKNLNLGELLAEGLKESPVLNMARFAKEKREYEKSLAKRDYFPDFNLGVSRIGIGDKYSFSDSGKTAWAASVGLNLPLWLGKKKGLLKSKSALKDSSAAAYLSVENSIRKKIEDLYFKLSASGKTAYLYKNAILPQSEEILRASSADYETGKIGIADWLGGENIFLKSKLSQYRNLANYYKNYALLERITGKLGENKNE